jgi:hypothetical protein
LRTKFIICKPNWPGWKLSSAVSTLEHWNSGGLPLENPHSLKELFMTIILTLHSIVRWLAVLVAVATIIKFASGWLKKQPFDKTASALAGAFGGMLDLQLTLGLLFFIWNGMLVGFGLRYRWEHLAVMTVAVIVAHLPSMWKKLGDEQRYRNSLLAFVAALLLVILGVSLLPGNRWLTITGLF